MMGLRYGMPSLIEYNSIEENMILCKQLHLDFIELNMNMFYCLPENNDIEHLKQLKLKYDLRFTMHFPEEIDFGCYYREISEANIALFKRFANYGNQIGVEKINIHLQPGTLVTLPDKKVWSYEKYVNQYVIRLKQALKQLIKIAENYHIQICIENASVPPYLVPVFLKIADIDGLCFTYDIGHDAKANFNVEQLYKELDTKVKHMHLHDYDLKTDHQVLFKGIINLYDRLSFAKKNEMTVVIEIKSIESLMKSVENLKMRSLI